MTDNPSQFSPRSVTEFHRDNRTNKTGFLGVKWNKRNQRYEAFIRVTSQKSKLYCGCSRQAEVAAAMYDAKARELYGPDAVTNFPAA